MIEAGPLEKLPLGSRLMWEPFTGHVSSDGTLGWLTGGYAVSSIPLRTLAGQGAYFSVWQREPDGVWRVWLDAGVRLPAVWEDAAPFRAAPEPDAGAAGEPNESIEAAERDVAGGLAAWRARLSSGVPLHRDGAMPFVGREAAAESTRNWSRVQWTVVTTRVAGSNDLGVALGGYDRATASGPTHGIWVRVWKRDVGGRWRIVFETMKPAQEIG
jgi:ketosteroid isomerase-like protein